MARIPLSEGFTIIPEGSHVFRIYAATYDEEFGKITIEMINAKGITHRERFFIKDKNDEINEGTINAFSYFAKTAMNDYGLIDILPEELVDHYIRADVVHTTAPSNRDPNKTVTFANLGEKSPADGFDTPPVLRAETIGRAAAKATSPATSAVPSSQQATSTAPQPAPSTAQSALDIDALLGN